MATTTLRVDPITKVLGNFGKWQLKTILIVFLCKVPTSWFMAIIIYTSPAPNPGDFWCTPPPDLPTNYTEDWKAKAHPQRRNYHNQTYTSYCEVYTDLWERPLDFFGTNQTKFDATNFTTMQCTNFSFDPRYHSMIHDFSLVCDREYWVPLSQVFHIAGLLVGGIVAYFMLKYISPRNVMIIGVSAQIVLGNLIGVIWVMEIHVVLRFLTAASCALMYTAGSMIFVDTTNGPAKTIAVLMFEFFWSIGLIVLPIFDVFIESWWKLYIAISMPTVLLVFFMKYLPDSPRWMLKHGRIDEARQILIDGGTKNKRRVPLNLEEMLKSEYNTGAGNAREATWCELWDGKPSKIFILAVHYAWSVYVLNFNCVVLNIRMYGRDHLWMNTMVIGFSEIIGVLFGTYVVLYTSRRWLWAGLAGIVCGILAYFTWFIPRGLTESHWVALEMAPALAIKAATSVGMCVLTVCTADLVSADRKKILMFSSTVWARAWFLWCPFIFVLRSFDIVLPLTVFASLSVIGGVLMIIIHQNQYKVYLEGCEQRIQAMRAVRTISEAGIDWIKNVRRRSSVYDMEQMRRKSLYDGNNEDVRKKSINEEDSSYERI